MDRELLWNKILSELKGKEAELQTTTGLWIKAYRKSDSVVIEKSSINSPASKLSKPRLIGKKDFSTIYPYYARKGSGESGLTQEATGKSQNTAYIYALIEKFQ